LFRKLRAHKHAADYEAIRYLLDNHQYVVIPNTRVKHWISKESRVLSKKQVSDCKNLAHYTFRQRLINKAQMYKQSFVYESREPGTSKTCTNCGAWFQELGPDKVFRCSRCGVHVSRDLAGARNNLFAAVGDILKLYHNATTST